MSATTDRLYGLLPEHLRVRDAEQGLPLRALVEVFAAEVDVLEHNVAEALDGWFIETCQEWMVPYIGDLLRVHGLVPVPGAPFSQRAVVANTVSYRRAKGTVGVLAQLARDHTGWPAVVVEFFRTLATTQHLDHQRPNNRVTCDLRATVALEQRGSAFDTVVHVADVRHVDTGRGRHNIPNLGVFLWRLQPYTMTDVIAGAGGTGGTRRYTFHPAGLDQPLFVAPRQGSPDPPGAVTDVPGPLTRELLFRDLGQRRSKAKASPLFPKSGEPVLQVVLDDHPVPPERMAVCDLSTWPDMAPSSDVDVGIDPQLGRVVVSPAVATPSSVRVTHTHVLAGDLGGGSYDRDADVLPHMAAIDAFDRGDRVALTVGGSGATAGSATECATLAHAVQKWNQLGGGMRAGVIALRDNGTYEAPDAAIEVPAGSRLLIVAAHWVPEADPIRDPQGQRWGRLEASELRPHIAGDLRVRGGGAGAALIVDGLLLSGGIAVEAGDLGLLRLSHSTLVPPTGGIAVATDGAGAGGDNEALCVEVYRSILGHARVPHIARLCLRDSVVRAEADDAIESAAPTAIDACTVFGRTAVRSLDASNSLFLEPVRAERRQVGCVRFCYLEPPSVVPRRYRCLPPDGGDRAPPRFTSTSYPQPGFAQLAWDAPEAIRRGSDDGDELGAFHFLRATARLDNLRRSLDEYLRFGLEAGVLFAT